MGVSTRCSTRNSDARRQYDPSAEKLEEAISAQRGVFL